MCQGSTAAFQEQDYLEADPEYSEIDGDMSGTQFHMSKGLVSSDPTLDRRRQLLHATMLDTAEGSALKQNWRRGLYLRR